MSKKMYLMLLTSTFILSGCATFRDACKTEATLIYKYGRDIDRCTDDLRAYSNRLGRDWVEISDRVYIHNGGF